MRPDTEVVVVGAGPTGLMLACELLRRGIDCRVLDGAPGPSLLSRACGLHARTIEIFDAIGIAEGALAEGHPATGADLHVDGRFVLRVPLDHPGTPYPFLLSLPQSRTEALLRARLAALGGRIEWDCPVQGVEPALDGVRVRLSRSELRARWVVGCDGAHSAIRRSLGLAFVGETHPETWLLADVRLQTELSDQRTHGFVSGEGYLALNPQSGAGRFRLIADVTGTPLADRADPSEAALQRELDRRRVPARLAELPEHTALFRTHCRRARQWRRGCALLAGDAAHIHSPMGGQGLNAGLQDAFNLGWKLAAVLRGAPSALLDSYESERRPIAEAILRGTERTRRALTLRAGPARWLLAALAPAAALAARRIGLASSGLDQQAPIGFAVRDLAPTAGALAPPGRFLGPADHPAWPLARTGLPVVLSRPDASALPPSVARWVAQAPLPERSPASRIVVRPDGVVALRCSEPDATPVLAMLGRLGAIPQRRPEDILPNERSQLPTNAAG